MNLAIITNGVYKEGHSTDLLLVKMTEDWRRALDNNLVVGVVFVDFIKAFDSISHPVLLRKLEEQDISGDLWSWIENYLLNSHQVTVINGCISKSMPVKFGVPQGLAKFSYLYSVTIYLTLTIRKVISTCMQTIPPCMHCMPYMP